MLIKPPSHKAGGSCAGVLTGGIITMYVVELSSGRQAGAPERSQACGATCATETPSAAWKKPKAPTGSAHSRQWLCASDRRT